MLLFMNGLRNYYLDVKEFNIRLAKVPDFAHGILKTPWRFFFEILKKIDFFAYVTSRVPMGFLKEMSVNLVPPFGCSYS